MARYLPARIDRTDWGRLRGDQTPEPAPVAASRSVSPSGLRRLLAGRDASFATDGNVGTG